MRFFSSKEQLFKLNIITFNYKIDIDEKLIRSI